jgi:hypothetical protein
MPQGKGCLRGGGCRKADKAGYQQRREARVKQAHGIVSSFPGSKAETGPEVNAHLAWHSARAVPRAGGRAAD